jgi:hypothetical protein
MDSATRVLAWIVLSALAVVLLVRPTPHGAQTVNPAVTSTAVVVDDYLQYCYTHSAADCAAAKAAGKPTTKSVWWQIQLPPGHDWHDYDMPYSQRICVIADDSPARMFERVNETEQKIGRTLASVSSRIEDRCDGKVDVLNFGMERSEFWMSFFSSKERCERERAGLAAEEQRKKDTLDKYR